MGYSFGRRAGEGTFAALLLCFAPMVANAQANLVAAYATPAYTLADRCDVAQPLVFVDVVLRNTGDARTPMQVTAADGADVFACETANVNPIPPGAQIMVAIRMHFVPTSGGAIAGTHAFSALAGAVRLAPIAMSCRQPSAYGRRRKARFRSRPFRSQPELMTLFRRRSS